VETPPRAGLGDCGNMLAADEGPTADECEAQDFTLSRLSMNSWSDSERPDLQHTYRTWAKAWFDFVGKVARYGSNDDDYLAGNACKFYASRALTFR